MTAPRPGKRATASSAPERHADQAGQGHRDQADADRQQHDLQQGRIAADDQPEGQPERLPRNRPIRSPLRQVHSLPRRARKEHKMHWPASSVRSRLPSRRGLGYRPLDAGRGGTTPWRSSSCTWSWAASSRTRPRPSSPISPRSTSSGLYPSYAEALTAWRGKAQATIDNAHVRYFVVHLHRLLDPGASGRAAGRVGRRERKKRIAARGPTAILPARSDADGAAAMDRLATIDWREVGAELDEHGCAVIAGLLDAGDVPRPRRTSIPMRRASAAGW